jgi:hypothetical protein
MEDYLRRIREAESFAALTAITRELDRKQGSFTRAECLTLAKAMAQLAGPR